MNKSKIYAVFGFLFILLAISLVSSRYANIEGYIGDAYNEVSKLSNEVDKVLYLQENESIVIDDELSILIENEKWLDVKASIEELQSRIVETQGFVDEYNGLQLDLLEDMGGENFNAIWYFSKINESEIIDSYANENSLDSSVLSMSDVIDAGYVFRGYIVIEVSDYQRETFEKTFELESAIEDSLVSMAKIVNDIGADINEIYGEKVIVSVCSDECTSEEEVFFDGGRKVCQKVSPQSPCLEWVEYCDDIDGMDKECSTMVYSKEEDACVVETIC